MSNGKFVQVDHSRPFVIGRIKKSIVQTREVVPGNEDWQMFNVTFETEDEANGAALQMEQADPDHDYVVIDIRENEFTPKYLH